MPNEVLCYMEDYLGVDVKFEPAYCCKGAEACYDIIVYLAMAFRGITIGRWPYRKEFYSAVYHTPNTGDAEIAMGKDILRKFISDKLDEAFIALDRYFWEGSSSPEIINIACIEIVHMIANGYIDNMYLDESRIENLLRIVNTNGMPHEAAILLNLGKGERNVSEFSL